MRISIRAIVVGATVFLLASATPAPSAQSRSLKETIQKRGCPRTSVTAPVFSTSLRVQWRVTYRSPTCFFFSGPGALGSYTPLGEQATYQHNSGAAALDFGNAVFRGVQENMRVSLTRRETYEHQGPWIATETLEGRWTSARPAGGACPNPSTLEATYTYHECEGTDPARCGQEGCTIRAVLTGVPTRAAQ